MNLFVIREPYVQWGMHLQYFVLYSWLRRTCSCALRAVVGWTAVRHVKGLYTLLPASSARTDRINGIGRPKG